MTVQPGLPAPAFALPSQEGKPVRLHDFAGRYVVLFFYPKDMTPTCTTEACDFRDRHAEFERLNAVILGISTDPVKRHQKFADKYGLPFLLLADEDHAVCEQYGVWKLKKTFGREYMGIERSTFLIGKDGRLLQEWRKVSVKGHVESALEAVKAFEDRESV
ncbi:putative peroxiredoxin YgaF [Paenibacillus sp. J31TS4]|uniref:thioredoxin-dependent thiol peroxidase n=1 Tax=Paenibacillus sp. J31TS4 TaxID=2807195 RepID=UPI001B20EEC8|nr:thioredoxin-dependent thiol peroxidase [Paenibacillus sp. J31TS4]GIP41116.1 putative peroxiredoxin YgaF [Paenibacillus sp. J31TS4]